VTYIIGPILFLNASSLCHFALSISVADACEPTLNARNACLVIRGLTSILLDGGTAQITPIAYDVIDLVVLNDIHSLNQFTWTPLVMLECSVELVKTWFSCTIMKQPRIIPTRKVMKMILIKMSRGRLWVLQHSPPPRVWLLCLSF
jgi:hypothetical protein